MPTGFTQIDVDRHNAKVAKLQPASAPVEAGGEKKLHQIIESELKARRILYFHDRMDMPTTGQLGRADFTVFPFQIQGQPVKLPIFIECKTAVGKLSREQAGFKLAAELSGYQYFVVRSLHDWTQIAGNI